jgi:RNase P protein component
MQNILERQKFILIEMKTASQAEFAKLEAEFLELAKKFENMTNSDVFSCEDF